MGVLGGFFGMFLGRLNFKFFFLLFLQDSGDYLVSSAPVTCDYMVVRIGHSGPHCRSSIAD